MPLQAVKQWWTTARPNRRPLALLDETVTSPHPALAPTPAADTSCALDRCRPGLCATVLGVACPALEAERLRTLGIYEGARVSVVDRCSGVLLEVCGTRLALDNAVASSILVQPAA